MSDLGPLHVGTHKPVNWHSHVPPHTHANTQTCARTHTHTREKMSKNTLLMGFPIVIPLTAASTTSNMNAVSSAEKHFIRVRQPLLPDIEEGRLKEIPYYLAGTMVSSNEIASEAGLGLDPDSLFSSCVMLDKLLNLSQLPHLRRRSNSVYRDGASTCLARWMQLWELRGWLSSSSTCSFRDQRSVLPTLSRE